MLGEQIGELTGQTISTRVLEDSGRGPRAEVIDHQIGTLCGAQAASAKPRASGAVSLVMGLVGENVERDA